MKNTTALLLAILTVGVFAGCEHEHWEHRGDHRGTPGPSYEYGRGYNFRPSVLDKALLTVPPRRRPTLIAARELRPPAATHTGRVRLRAKQASVSHFQCWVWVGVRLSQGVAAGLMTFAPLVQDQGGKSKRRTGTALTRISGYGMRASLRPWLHQLCLVIGCDG